MMKTITCVLAILAATGMAANAEDSMFETLTTPNLSLPKDFTHDLTVTAEDGKPIFIIHMDTKKIEVPDGVDVNDTARRVIDAMAVYLNSLCGSGER